MKEIKPEIWRRIQVPENYNFWDLHIAIQDAMGWLDCHLHQFHVKNKKTGNPEFIGIPDESDNYDIPMLPGWKILISDFFSIKNKKILYEYDFGDGWDHEIILEKILSKESNIKYPVCLGGERACPPEDCGGYCGYENFLKIIKDPKHKEYKNMMLWSGGHFDSESLNVKKIIFSDPKNRLKRAMNLI